ncbi:MAG: hypothetical protein AAGA56_03595, partial [Myxococcota bacterium]
MSEGSHTGALPLQMLGSSLQSTGGEPPAPPAPGPFAPSPPSPVEVVDVLVVSAPGPPVAASSSPQPLGAAARL